MISYLSSRRWNKTAGVGSQMQENVSDLESRYNRVISPTWMYDWMQDLMDLDNWKQSVNSDEDLSNVFAFRESKIYILKRAREKLHRLQTTMVRLESIPSCLNLGRDSAKPIFCFCSPRGECSTPYRFTFGLIQSVSNARNLPLQPSRWIFLVVYHAQMLWNEHYFQLLCRRQHQKNPTSANSLSFISMWGFRVNSFSHSFSSLFPFQKK